MARLPRWLKVIETQDKGATVVIAVRWWHPHVWGICYRQCRQEILEYGLNPNHLAMRWKTIKVVVQTVWKESKRSWIF